MKPSKACQLLLFGLAVCHVPSPVAAQDDRGSERGIPGRREGAGTRGSCLEGQKALMPLAPPDGFATTISNSPTFLWYVPATTARSAEFTLTDGNDKTLYKTSIKLTGTGGIVSFSPPTNALSSFVGGGKNGKKYFWQFSVICDLNEPSKNPFVEGVVQKVQPSPRLVNQLRKTTPRSRPLVYAAAGVWQDAIASLVEQRCSRPSDPELLNHWTQLLQSVQLQGFAKESLAASCMAISSKSRL